MNDVTGLGIICAIGSAGAGAYGNPFLAILLGVNAFIIGVLGMFSHD